jgi:hypothetical protein
VLLEYFMDSNDVRSTTPWHGWKLELATLARFPRFLVGFVLVSNIVLRLRAIVRHLLVSMDVSIARWSNAFRN